MASQVVPGFLVRFEIRLVPALASQAKRGRGNFTLDGATLPAVGTRPGIRVGQLLQALEALATGVAVIHMDGHGWAILVKAPQDTKYRHTRRFVLVLFPAATIMWGFDKGKSMPSNHLAGLAIWVAAMAPGMPAIAAATAEPACPANPPSQPAAWIAHVEELNRGLGIPPDYAALHNLVALPEAKELVQVPRDIYGRKVEMTPGAAAALKKMIAAAARDGVELQTVSGFRSIAYQTGLVRRKLKSGMSIEKALSINAVPGYSEHQTGCAIDLTTPGVPAADGSFAGSKAFAWLQKHAAEYGFHLSFPPGNRYGYEYEPWHWRYVAPEPAKKETRGQGRLSDDNAETTKYPDESRP